MAYPLRHKKADSVQVLNNQIIKSSTTAINIGSNNVEDNFFEAFNLARHTV